MHIAFPSKVTHAAFVQLRTTNIDKLQDGVYDTLVIGGGINGAVSAAALSARGARVALIDRADFAGFTSQNSSNLAWGGIKYLESGELALVRKLCKSRNHLMQAFPSTVQEIRFLTTVASGFRWPRFILYLGAVLYWIMGSFFTRGPRLWSRRLLEHQEPIIANQNAKGGFEYSDAILYDNDARFVFGFVRQAMTYGCIAANYVESLGGARDKDGYWCINARDRISGRDISIRARVLVNAAGPYVDHHNTTTAQDSNHRHVLSKGIHLIVERLAQSNRVLTFFADDGRPFFAIPMGNRTVIGTTDTRVSTPETEITEADRDFVLDNINKRLRLPSPLTRADIIAERCGVRPLVVKSNGKVVDGDWTKLSRKHVIETSRSTRHICVYGGKLTDCINVGNEVSEVVNALGINLPYPKQRWYGEPSKDIRDEYLHQASLLGLDEMTSPHSSEPLSRRLWRRYGARAIGMLEDIRRNPKNAEILIETSEYIRCEIYRLARHEMVVTLDDFLRRRSKIAQVVPREALRKSAGLKEACEILFGDESEQRWIEYFDDDPTTDGTVVPVSTDAPNKAATN